MTDTTLVRPALPALFPPALTGEVLRPGDARYEERRRLWNALGDARPALIVRPRDAAGVASAVRFARYHGLPLAVRSGGHSPAGFSTVEGGLVIDLGEMRALSVDPASRLVRAEPGLTWGEVARALQPHGLAITAGDVGSVGVGGLTQGGGIGWFVRRFGLNVDRLRAVELVTAAGELLRASATERPELFWGVRGGGANLGVVTAYEFEAHEGGTVLGGLVFYPGDDAARLLREYARLAQAAPEGLSTQGLLVAAPPLPFLPASMVGRPLVVVAVCFSGDLAEGERVLAPLRRLAEPLLDTVGEMPYAAMLEMPPFDTAGDRGLQHHMRSAFLPGLPDAFFDALAGAALAADHPGRLVQLRVLGGEMRRAPAGDTAFAHRDKAALLMVAHLCPEGADAGMAEATRGATAAVFEAVRPFAAGTYGNFLAVGEEDRAPEVFGDRLARLAALKAELDPHNVFARNANVRPAGPGLR